MTAGKKKLHSLKVEIMDNVVEFIIGWSFDGPIIWRHYINEEN